MAIIFEYVKVPILDEADPAAQLARQIMRLLDESPQTATAPPALHAVLQSHKHHITGCNIAPYVTMDAHEPNGVEIQCSIRLVNNVPH